MVKKAIASILVLVVGLPIAGYVVFRALKEGKRTRQIDEEIMAMQAEADDIRQGNEILREKIAYLETPEYQEKIAKEKLNLQKAGEQVAIIKPSPSLQMTPEETGDNSEGVALVDERPNYLKWWEYFFKY